MCPRQQPLSQSGGEADRLQLPAKADATAPPAGSPPHRGCNAVGVGGTQVLTLESFLQRKCRWNLLVFLGVDVFMGGGCNGWCPSLLHVTHPAEEVSSMRALQCNTTQQLQPRASFNPQCCVVLHWWVLKNTNYFLPKLLKQVHLCLLWSLFSVQMHTVLHQHLWLQWSGCSVGGCTDTPHLSRCMKHQYADWASV